MDNCTVIVYVNESGRFTCSKTGKLMDYVPSADNILKPVLHERYTYHDAYYEPCVKHLVIPEGVTSFKAEFFREGYVRDRIVFPSTLVSIGDDDFDDNGCVFANTILPDVVIPESVKMIGIFAFGASQIKSVRFPRGFSFGDKYLRQFKGCHIGNLILPARMEFPWRDNGIDQVSYY